MKIHQILINDTNKLPDKLPEFHNFCFNQIKKIYPNSEYKLYSGEDIEKIIKNNFDKEVLLSYKKLKPYACKADLARYCILYLYGGLYADLNTYFVRNIPNTDCLNFFAFRDDPKASMQSWAVHNGIIYSDPKAKPLEKCIELIKMHCKKEYYGISSVDVSATTVLGRAITLSMPNLNIATTGQLHSIPKKYIDKKLMNKLKDMGYNQKFLSGFVMDANDEIIAIKKPSPPGDIISLGFEKTNNYDEIWRSFDVYEELIDFNKNLIYK